MSLQTSVIEYVLGKVLPEDLPDIAVKALEENLRFELARELAGGQGCDTRELHALFRRAIDELRLPFPSPIDAAHSMACSIADEIVDGKVSPYVGAKRIWSERYTRYPSLSDLRVFVGLASEYEDDETHRDGYAKEIVINEAEGFDKPKMK